MKFDTNDNIETFLLTLNGQILTHKDSKAINIARQFIQNKAKISHLLPPRHGFEPSTIQMVKINTLNGKICKLIHTWAQVRIFLWSQEGQI